MQIYEDKNGLKVKASSVEANKPIDGNFYLLLLGKSTFGLKFQDGAPNVNGLNGYTNESLLSILIHRTEILNSNFPCVENENAIALMKATLAALESRTQQRMLRGVEGTHTV